MSRLTQMVEGWTNNLTPEQYLDAKVIEVSNIRMLICEQCSNHSKHYKTIRPDAHCVACGCTLSAKTKCLTCDCPDKKWMATDISK